MLIYLRLSFSSTYVLCFLKTNDNYGKELINYVDSINYLHMGGQATNTDNSKR